MAHHIVFLDRATLGATLRTPQFDHTWDEYPATDAGSTEARLFKASIAIVNKVPLRRQVLEKLPQLKLIAMAATGYDVVDVAYCKSAGIRVVNIRSGHVLSKDGGLLGRLIPLFKLGLGGRLGGGRQWMSWIARDDHIAALRFLIYGDLAGPVNLATPNAVTNADFTKALGVALNRPAILAVPPFALRVALDGLADEGALISLRIVPGKLTAAGFAFRHPELDEALAGLT